MRVFNLLKAKNEVIHIKTQFVLLLTPDMLYWANVVVCSEINKIRISTLCVQRTIVEC